MSRFYGGGDRGRRGSGRGGDVPARPVGVWFSPTYSSMQAGSIDGTDTTPHDHAIKRATNASYDPSLDPRIVGDPFLTLFVGRLSPTTTEGTLHEAFQRYGPIKALRVVRDVATGASRRYAFVEFEDTPSFLAAYRAAHRMSLDGVQIMVEFERGRVMPGFIPRRFGGGLGGRKESGQLRFGGRDRPFRIPLIPGTLNPTVPRDAMQALEARPGLDSWRRARSKESEDSARRRSRSHGYPERRDERSRHDRGERTHRDRDSREERSHPPHHHHHHSSSRSHRPHDDYDEERRSRSSRDDDRHRSYPSSR